MENKIMMPASYNVLSCEEMTYTEGGATVGQAVAAWLWPGYATVIGINTCREARKKDHDNWVSNVWSDIKADCKGNVTNTFYHAHDLLECCIDHQQLWPFLPLCLWASSTSNFQEYTKGLFAALFNGRAAAFLSNLKRSFAL